MDKPQRHRDTELDLVIVEVKSVRKANPVFETQVLTASSTDEEARRLLINSIRACCATASSDSLSEPSQCLTVFVADFSLCALVLSVSRGVACYSRHRMPNYGFAIDLRKCIAVTPVRSRARPSTRIPIA